MALALGAIVITAAAPIKAPIAPPAAAPVRPVTDDYFGTKVVDNYRYMEDLKDPEVQKWMKAQADYTRRTLDALSGYSALLKRIAELDASEPAQVSNVQIVGGRYYSLRLPAGSQSPKLYVRAGVKGQDKLLIDPEKIPGSGKSHYSIHDYRPSPDGRYVAYQLAAGGSEESVLHIFDVAAGRDVPEIADRSDGDPSWRADSRSFFYPRLQKLEPGMPATAKTENSRVYLHVIGRSFDADPPIFGRGVNDAIAITPDEYPTIITVPRSHYAIGLVSPGTDPRSRIYAASINAIDGGKPAWRTIAASYDDQFIRGYSNGPVIALAGDTLYWLSRKNASRGEILKLDLARPSSKPQIVIRQGALPISAVYAGRDAIYWRVSDAGVNGIHRLRLAKGARPEALQLPYAASIEDVSADSGGDSVVLIATSWLRPPALLGVDPKNETVADTGLQPTGPYDHPDDLTVEEVKVRSWDGTLVPLSIVHKKGLNRDGRNTAMLTGYGAYGTSTSPFYVPGMRVWYDHAQMIAFAHVRGGGEYGEAWHKAGFQATKPNTWKDFIACARYLVDRRYTNPRKLVGMAQSAGGILIGRAIEERPDLFGAAIIRVPLADTLRFHITANGPGNVPEFGNVRTESGFKALYAMSPYAHVSDGVKYPPVLVYAGANDQRVDAWIPAKFAARLQAATASGKPVLLRVDYDAGHTGFDATRRQVNLNTADMVAFGLWQTGDPEFQPKH
jgi:prolyl oligopeptidase